MTIERTIAWFKERPAVLIGSVALVAISSTMTIVDGAKRLFEFYAVTIGYNNELDRKLNALRVEVDIGYLNGILGPPAVINERTIRSTHVPSITGKSIEKRLEFKEYFYINRDFYVQAVTDMRGKIGMYSITARTKNYAPEIDTSLDIKVRLGRSTYSEISKIPEKIAGLLGANLKHFNYYEIYSIDPGNYRYAIFSSNPNGHFEAVGTLDWEIKDTFAKEFSTDSPLFPMHAKHRSFRRGTTINTYSVTTPWFDGIDLTDNGVNYGGGKINFGPHVDQVSMVK